MAQMVHVARASFDSLASGMPIYRVFLQQAPQFFQALLTGFAGIAQKITSLLFNPLTWVAAASAAFGAVLYFWGAHLAKMADGVNAFQKKIGDSAGPLERIARAMKSTAEHARAAADAASDWAGFLSKSDAGMRDTAVETWKKKIDEAKTGKGALIDAAIKDLSERRDAAILQGTAASKTIQGELSKDYGEDALSKLSSHATTLDEMFKSGGGGAIYQAYDSVKKAKTAAQLQQLLFAAHSIGGLSELSFSKLPEIPSGASFAEKKTIILNHLLDKQVELSDNTVTSMRAVNMAWKDVKSQADLHNNEQLTGEGTKRAAQASLDSAKNTISLMSQGIRDFQAMKDAGSQSAVRSDSLLKVGNFLGSSGVNGMKQIAEKHLKATQDLRVPLDKIQTYAANISKNVIQIPS
jgi:hypothetical protein